MTVEDVSTFRRRARAWVEANVPRADEVVPPVDSRERVEHAQSLQRRIFDAGFGAIAWPQQYGGLDLTAAHMRAFTEALQGHQDPYTTLSVSLGVVGPTLLHHGTPEQKATHLPPLLRGDTLWVQYLSEPSAGSDMAAVLTRGDRAGDDWVLNGSKVWTTFGDLADYALCLTRTDWDAQKHAGLSMFIVPVRSPGLTVLPLTQASGSQEFCQEYLEDVHVPGDHLLGAEGAGWAVATALLGEERRALGGGSPYFSAGTHSEGESDPTGELVALADRSGRRHDPLARQLVAELHAEALVGEQLAARVATGIASGVLAAPSGSLLKLYAADLSVHSVQARVDLTGPAATAWADGDAGSRSAGLGWLTRQGVSIMGGANEIQRNIISERVLGLPREPAPDKDGPFRSLRAPDRTA